EEMLKAKYSIEIDKRKIVSKIAIDRLGYTKLDIELYKGVIGHINVHVSEKK
ncbi:MAG TPA: 50S ribosomal protein L9, partial [Firmicutes bacterium]|nr:50S ribosomal protein L9 [Bacillota bacterium]